MQVLPFGELSWEDFERLCLRLVVLEADVEHCQPYGTRGQWQGGIDIYARRRLGEKYAVYQCKRVKEFGPAQIKDAVGKFLKGDWVECADTFVLCTSNDLTTSQSADAIEEQNAILSVKGISLLPWDSNKLSEKLKGLPKLVDDFFGREWVRVFCGQDQADKLGDRLTAGEVTRLRDRLSRLYGNVFDEQDPGLPDVSEGDMPSLAFENRYVLPDVYEGRVVGFARQEVTPEDGISDSSTFDEELRSSVLDIGTPDKVRKSARPYRRPTAYRQRRTVEDWLASGDRGVVLGGPGSGKSSLLRFVAKDLLKENPSLSSVAREWGGLLPVWVPFAFWVKSISDQAATVRSLSEVVHRWLVHFDEEQLWPLVEKALEDERLLLLVDGLDEYRDETAATVALDQLKVFVRQRDVPAVVTSRPHGFDRLGMQSAGWRIAELAEFSTAQQKELARMWFSHRARSSEWDLATDDRNVEELAEAQAGRFISELRRTEDVDEIARVPLLLNLLIYLRFANARLPQSRFKAYEAIIDHLIAKHPYRKRAAALLTEGVPSELSDDEIKDCFAYLAYCIQERFGEGVIERNEAATAFKEYLRDEDLGLGYDRHEAHRIGRSLVGVGAETVGLLVERSPTELGFFHRAFQEFLAALHLARMSSEQQFAVLWERRADPRWHEVLLGLFHLMRRPADTRAFAEYMRNAEKQLDEAERHYLDLLLCEVACGDFNVPVGLAKELVERAFEYVELGSWMPQRERLLELLLEGLRSSKVRDLVQAKVSEWFPCRTPSRQDLFSAVGNWPFVPETVDILWRGMHDEETGNQRASARALADLAAGESVMGNRVADLALRSVNPDTRAAALEGLLRGWPEHEYVGRALCEARSSLSPELRLVAIMGRVQLNQQDEEDRKELLRFSSRGLHVDYDWQSEVAPTLVAGWPGSPEIKELYLADLRKPLGESKMDPSIAPRVLLEGYPQDEEVAEYCAEEITTERNPFVTLHSGAWRLLVRNFKDHPKVVAATDEWISQQETDIWPDLAQAALIGRTPLAKAKLLSSLDLSGYDHLYAQALLEGWGMQDAEVAEKLRQMALGPAAKASRFGAILHQIIGDKDECRERLVELLEDPDCELPNAVIQGLMNLDDDAPSARVLDVALNILPDRLDTEDIPYREVVALLVKWQGSDTRVKELAEKELERRTDGYGNFYYVVAEAYGGDESMRQRIATIACPLPTALRETIAARLGAGYADNDFVLPLLGLYDHEHDGNVKAQASISYHERLRDSGCDVETEVRRLSEDIVAYGLDLDERRQGAFCGLVTLGRLDILMEAREHRAEDKPVRVGLAEVITPNVPMLRLVLQHWDDIKTSLGEDVWDRIVFTRLHGDERNLYELWDAFCAFADEYPSPRQEALDFLEYREERSAGPDPLRFLGRTRPRSGLLLDYCLGTLHGELNSARILAKNPSIVAAELLREHFGGDEDVLRYVAGEGDDTLVQENTIIALCEGWPDSEELERAYRILRDRQPPMFYPAYFQLASRKFESQTMLAGLMNALEKLRPAYFYSRDPQDIVRPITRRLRTDDQLLTLLHERLRNNPTASEKATIPQLIASARGVAADLREWCTEELNRQADADGAPEIGFDLNVGALVPVKHSLLRILDAQLTRSPA